MQKILNSNNNYHDIQKCMENSHCKNILLVCGSSFYNSILDKRIKEIANKLEINIHYFSDFEPNPSYESVCLGVEKFNKYNCDFLIVAGGGSAIDVAKCIKSFVRMDHNKNYLEQEIIPNNIEILAIPTTAGTGSEATKFAVIYYNGIKQSVENGSIIPQYVLFEPSFLKTLSLYQKKATVLDAFSHSVESLWSINSTDKSIEYSKKAIKLIVENFEKYLKNDETTFENMMIASNYAGKAINITKTTAGHAMCYKLTSLYKIAHGHAAMLINSELLPFMMDNSNRCKDLRGEKHLNKIFVMISDLLDCSNLEELKNYFRELLKKLDLYNISVDYQDIKLLVNSVNVDRLSNNPVILEDIDIKEIYTKLFDRIMEVTNESN